MVLANNYVIPKELLWCLPGGLGWGTICNNSEGITMVLKNNYIILKE
jgi:hypothetical protein